MTDTFHTQRPVAFMLFVVKMLRSAARAKGVENHALDSEVILNPETQDELVQAYENGYLDVETGKVHKMPGHIRAQLLTAAVHGGEI